MSRTASADEEAKSCAGSSSPSTTMLTCRLTDLRIAVSLLNQFFSIHNQFLFDSTAEFVERRPPSVLVDLDLHDRVNLPDRSARLADLVGVFGVEHEPAAYSHALVPFDDLSEHIRLPVRVVGSNARRDLDDD